jgi:hypothetical protein
LSASFLGRRPLSARSPYGHDDAVATIVKHNTVRAFMIEGAIVGNLEAGPIEAGTAESEDVCTEEKLLRT